jgi:sarcosine oxidase subunit gamma
MREIPFKTHLNLRGDPKDPKFLSCASSLLGVDLPLAPNGVVESSGWQVCWLGPDEWLLIGLGDQDVSVEFRNQFSQFHSAVVDLSGGQTIIRAGGHAWRDVLASACPLDLHPSVFKPRQCAQTVFAHTNVLLISVSDEDNDEVKALDIVVRRSFADHVGRWLIDAAAECGFEFELPIG